MADETWPTRLGRRDLADEAWPTRLGRRDVADETGRDFAQTSPTLGWGGRIRTSEWRNQNPPISVLTSTRIPKKLRNSSRYRSIGYRSGRNGFCLAVVATLNHSHRAVVSA